MGVNQRKPEREASQLKSAEQEGAGKSLTPPAFQLKSEPAQMKREEEGVSQQKTMGEMVSGVGSWLTGLFNPQGKDGNTTPVAGGETTTPAAEGGQTTTPTAESEAAEQQQEQVQEVTTDEQTAAPEQTREERIAALLQAHYDGFAAISVNVPNPLPTPEQPTLACEVRPPYMINSGSRITNAEANRAANRRVNALLNTFSWGFRHGKASASDIQSFLQRAIDQGLTTDNTSAGLRSFLETYGVGVDCSGFTSQGYNSLMEELGLTDEARMSVNDTGSGSFRDASSRFTAVSSPADLKPGDALYLDNPNGIDHVRMVQNVTVNGTNIDFVTIESAGGTTNGPRQKHWRFTDATDFDSLQHSTDGGTTYTDSTENPEFARFDALYPAEEEQAETQTQQTGPQ